MPRKPVPGRRARPADRTLGRDASGLYAVMTDLLRLYQFRDRDRAGYHGLTVTQCYVLDALERAGTSTLRSLAAELRLDKSTASRIVSGMLRRGFVRRGADPGDGRAMRLESTATGRRRYARVRRDLVAENARLLKEFSPATRQNLIRLIRALAAAVARRELVPVEDPAGPARRRAVRRTPAVE